MWFLFSQLHSETCEEIQKIRPKPTIAKVSYGSFVVYITKLWDVAINTHIGSTLTDLVIVVSSGFT